MGMVKIGGDFYGIVVNPLFWALGVLGVLKGVNAIIFNKNAQKRVKIWVEY